VSREPGTPPRPVSTVAPDGRLYRTTNKTFEGYCQDRWGMTDRRARQLMSAAGVIADVKSGTIVPATESQARPLAPLGPNQRREAWQLAVESAPNGRPTARDVNGGAATSPRSALTSRP
jgi:hypothetical protein